jgi:YfiH family protein
MIRHRLDLALPGGVQARMVLTGRGGSDGATASGGSSRWPFAAANLGSHVGDDPEAVRANRTALAEALGVPAAAMTFMHPDHGRGVALVTEPTGVAPGAELRDVDALVTDRVGVALVALAADCVPILLVEPDARVVAAVHCGWRGLALDVLGAAVDAMVGLGARAANLRAVLGPAICGACYPVPPQRAAELARVRPEAVTTAPDGQPAIDLRAGLLARLAELGASAEVVGGCTAEDPQGSFSHRRDGRTGRQGGAVALVAA